MNARGNAIAATKRMGPSKRPHPKTPNAPSAVISSAKRRTRLMGWLPMSSARAAQPRAVGTISDLGHVGFQTF